VLCIGHKTNPATNGPGECFFKTDGRGAQIPMHNVHNLSSQEVCTCMGKMSKFDEEMWLVEVERTIPYTGEQVSQSSTAFLPSQYHSGHLCLPQAGHEKKR
jgi:hypothetical protein